MALEDEPEQQEYAPKKKKSDEEYEKRKKNITPGSLMKAMIRSGEDTTKPVEGDQVILHCTIRTLDGVIVNSTRSEHGGKGCPNRYIMGKSKMLLGLCEAIPTMSKGEVAMFKMKPELHYAEVDCPVTAPEDFPKDVELHFEIEILDYFKAKIVSEDLGVVKKIIDEGQGWECPREPYEVEARIITKTADGKVILSHMNNPYHFTFGKSEIPKGLEMGIGTMTKREKAVIFVNDSYFSKSSLMQIPEGHEEVQFEVELVHFTQVRDMLGDGRLIKRRIRDGKGQLLMEKMTHLYWTPCAAHCIDLMLEDIGKLSLVKNVIKKVLQLTGYIYNHGIVLNIMRKYTNGAELVRLGITHFATSFLTLASIYKQKENLRRMFVSEDWSKSRFSVDLKGKKAKEIILKSRFWNDIAYSLKVTSPLVKMLRLVDSDKRPAMGYIYEAMDRVKEAISCAFKNDQRKYESIFSIIDNRWQCQLRQPLHQAGYYLNPEFFYKNKLKIQADDTLMEGLYAVISRLVADSNERMIIDQELSIYNHAGGLFATKFAIRNRDKRAPSEFPMDCPLQDSLLRVHYKGMLLDEERRVFYDTRVDNNGEPFEFCSGEGLVPEGFEMSVRLMLPGEISLITCPPDYAYDRFKRPANVPEGAHVLWEIELLGFEMPKDWTGLNFQNIMDEVEKIKNTGKRLFKEGKYELAKAKYDKVLREYNHVNPQDDEEGKTFLNSRNTLHLNVAACYQKMGEYRKSIETCNKVLDANPVHVKAIYRRGMAHMLNGDFEVARKDFNAMISMDESSEPDAKSALQKLKQEEQEAERKAKKQFKGLFDKKPGEISEAGNISTDDQVLDTQNPDGKPPEPEERQESRTRSVDAGVPVEAENLGFFSRLWPSGRRIFAALGLNRCSIL